MRFYSLLSYTFLVFWSPESAYRKPRFPWQALWGRVGAVWHLRGSSQCWCQSMQCHFSWNHWPALFWKDLEKEKAQEVSRAVLQKKLKSKLTKERKKENRRKKERKKWTKMILFLYYEVVVCRSYGIMLVWQVESFTDLFHVMLCSALEATLCSCFECMLAYFVVSIMDQILTWIFNMHMSSFCKCIHIVNFYS